MWVNFKLMTAVSVGQFKIVVDNLRDVRLKRPWKLGLIALVGAFLVGVLVVQPSLGEFSLLSACLGALVLLAVMLFAETLTAPRRQIVSEGR